MACALSSGCARRPHRRAPFDGGQIDLPVLDQLVREFCRDIARRDHIHADAVAGPFADHLTRHRRDTRLGTPYAWRCGIPESSRSNTDSRWRPRVVRASFWRLLG